MQNSAAAVPQIYWRNALFLTITLVVAAVAVPLYIVEYGLSWSLFLAFLVTAAATNLSITAGYHRMFSHRSYEARPWLKLVYLLLGAAAFQGSALQWSADHRRHHRMVDTDDDPHNINRGFFWAHMGWLFFTENPKYAGKYPADLERDALVKWQHDYYVYIATGMGFVLPTLVGWAFGNALGALIFCGLLRTVVTNHCTFLINSLAHTLGSRTYSASQTARDSVIMAFLAFGEGYHNFHHVFASDYRNGIKWYHWDPTKWLIKVTSWCGGAYRLKKIPHSEILRMRLRNEHRLLVLSGAPADRVAALKERVEEAMKRWRTQKEAYVATRRARAEQIGEDWRRRVLQLKAELKVARLEFKLAWAQWGVYRRTLRPARAL